MTGFQSRVRDVINQAAPLHATVAVADRGLSHFIDPSMTGPARFMQKAGYPFPLLTPQISATLTAVASVGTRTVTMAGARLLPWLREGMTVSLELTEQAIIEDISETAVAGEVRLTLETPLVSSHDVGTRLHIWAFPISVVNNTTEGDGGAAGSLVQILSPFLLVVGDTITISGKAYELRISNELSSTDSGRTYEVAVTADEGLPALSPSDPILVLAKPAYRSELLAMPHVDADSFVRGPVAIDWVSGPMVADYLPSPESRLFLEEFSASHLPIADPQEVSKNHVLTRLPIARDQLLFWNVAQGSVNWNGTYMELRAHDAGRAHLWTPCRPPLEAAALTSVNATVPGFAPYTVLLMSRLLSESVRVVDRITGAPIADTEYTVDETAGTIAFTAPHASQAVRITYRPKMEWQIFVRPSVDDLEVVITIGREPKQTFTLGAAGSSNILTVRVETDEPIDQIHLTVRRPDDSAGPFTLEVGDWQQRGRTCGAIRYTLLTGADIDYDWASSGLLLKSMWPTLEILRARLDGSGIFARHLDNGRILF